MSTTEATSTFARGPLVCCTPRCTPSPPRLVELSLLVHARTTSVLQSLSRSQEMRGATSAAAELDTIDVVLLSPASSRVQRWSASSPSSTNEDASSLAPDLEELFFNPCCRIAAELPPLQSCLLLLKFPKGLPPASSSGYFRRYYFRDFRRPRVARARSRGNHVLHERRLIHVRQNTAKHQSRA